MAQIMECDGCGKQTRKDEKAYGNRIFRMNLSAEGAGTKPDVEADIAGWTADLCKTCLNRVSDPKEWPRAESE